MRKGGKREEKGGKAEKKGKKGKRGKRGRVLLVQSAIHPIVRPAQ